MAITVSEWSTPGGPSIVSIAISGVTIRNGHAPYGGKGGGLYMWRSVVTVSHCTVKDNRADRGGGIYTSEGRLWVNSSTIRGNFADEYGGGIYNASNTTIRNSTISGNRAGSWWVHGGGGIASHFDTLTLINSTVTRNSGGGIHKSTWNWSTLMMVSSIVAQQARGQDCRNAGGIVSYGHNIDGDGSCNLTQPTDLPNTNPLLGPLADNGGPTWTHAPLPDTPVIDAGSCPGTGTDQRGMPRPVDLASWPNAHDGCDIGAVELGCYDGSITAPTDGTCTAEAVTIEDNFARLCDPDLTRVYEPGPGPTYWDHGDYEVTLKVTDGADTYGEDSVAFTIDTASPVLEWIGLPSSLSLPMDLEFHSSDDDGAAGEVVHEVMKLDECLIYDGATYGEHPNGLLSDEELVLSKTELCRISRECGFDTLVDPQILVEGTDCSGNVGYDTHTFLGAVVSRTGICEGGAE